MNDTEKFVYEVMEDYAGATDKREHRACVRLLSRRLEAAAALAIAVAELLEWLEDDEYTPVEKLQPIRTALRQWEKANNA